MSLEIIQPLKFDRYYAELLGIGFWQHIAQRVDWYAELRGYQYNDQDWLSGIRVRLCFHRDFRRAQREGSDGEHCFQIANQIMQWGGMKPLKLRARFMLD